jgi:hypothetical protein
MDTRRQSVMLKIMRACSPNGPSNVGQHLRSVIDMVHELAWYEEYLPRCDMLMSTSASTFSSAHLMQSLLADHIFQHNPSQLISSSVSMLSIVTLVEWSA